MQAILFFASALAGFAVATTGDATYFTQNGNAGSCGIIHQDTDYVVALSYLISPDQYCGQTVTITNMGGGQQNNGVGTTITATVADTCPDADCDAGHLDLSEGAFKALTGGNLDPPGEFSISWDFGGATATGGGTGTTSTSTSTGTASTGTTGFHSKGKGKGNHNH